jgi:hypothetical protein
MPLLSVSDESNKTKSIRPWTAAVAIACPDVTGFFPHRFVQVH